MMDQMVPKGWWIPVVGVALGWLFLLLGGCAYFDTIEDIADAVDWAKLSEVIAQDDGLPPPPPVEATPEEEPEPVNKGGWGLYKPESSLWLAKLGVRAPQVKTAGEYRPDGTVVKWLQLGNRQGPRADGQQPAADSSNYYHSNRLKFRDAKVTASGNTLKLVTRDGKTYTKTIVDRNVRQE